MDWFFEEGEKSVREIHPGYTPRDAPPSIGIVIKTKELGEKHFVSC
jgi:hypothetical protein